MNKRSLFGVFVIILGGILLVGSLNIADTRDMLGLYWPIVIILFGGYKLVDGSQNYGFAAILILLGTVILGKNAGIPFLEDVNVWSLFWPVIIILFGIHVLFGRNISKEHITTDDALDVIAVFGGAEVRNESSDFKGGNVTTVFGGAEIDLRNAHIQDGDTAYIEAFAAFGGCDIRVPENWKVQVRMVPIFGGWGNKTAYSKDTSQPVKLVVKGFIAFGGVDIKN